MLSNHIVVHSDLEWNLYSYFTSKIITCYITSKVNDTPKGVYLPISKEHSNSAVANLLTHINKSQFCYCGQISLQSAAVNYSLSDNMTHLGVPFILLLMIHWPLFGCRTIDTPLTVRRAEDIEELASLDARQL